MMFMRAVYEHKIKLAEEWANSISPQEADRMIDNHTDGPWEGGCQKCWYKKPCLEAAVLSRIVLEHEDNTYEPNGEQAAGQDWLDEMQASPSPQ